MFISRFYNVLCALNPPYAGSPAIRVSSQVSKQAATSRRYFLIELPLSSAGTLNEVNIGREKYTIIGHHISIDREHEAPGQERRLSTYHYTATLHNTAAEEHILHVYFNSSQQAAHTVPTLKKGGAFVPIPLDTHIILKEIANLYTKPFMLWLIQQQKNILQDGIKQLATVDAQINRLHVISDPNRVRYQELLDEKIRLLIKMQPFTYQISQREINTLRMQHEAITQIIAQTSKKLAKKAAPKKHTPAAPDIDTAVVTTSAATSVPDRWATETELLMARIAAVPVKVTNEDDALTAQNNLALILRDMSKLPSHYYDAPFLRYIERVFLLQEQLLTYRNLLVQEYGLMLDSASATSRRSALAEEIGALPATLLTQALIEDNVEKLKTLLADFKPDLDACTINFNGQDLPLIAYCLVQHKTQCFGELYRQGASLQTKLLEEGVEKTLYLKIFTESKYYDAFIILSEVNPSLFTKDFILKILDMAKSDLDGVTKSLELAQARQRLQAKLRRGAFFSDRTALEPMVVALKQSQQTFDSYSAMMRAMLELIELLNLCPSDMVSGGMTKLLKTSNISVGIAQHINAVFRIEANFSIAHLFNHVVLPLLSLLTPENRDYIKSKFGGLTQIIDSTLASTLPIPSTGAQVAVTAGGSSLVSIPAPSVMSMLAPMLGQAPAHFSQIVTPERMSLLNKFLAHPAFSEMVNYLITKMKLAELFNDFLNAWQQKSERDANLLTFVAEEMPRLSLVLNERIATLFADDDSEVYRLMDKLLPVLSPIITEYQQLTSGGRIPIAAPSAAPSSALIESVQALLQAGMSGGAARSRMK